MATKSLATWALALNFTNIPSPAIDLAIKSVYNWAGCAIGGYSQPAPGIAFQAIQPYIGAQKNATILGTDIAVDLQTAALINGIASHADDYDDTHRDNSIHPSGPILSALLAFAQSRGPVNGHDFITAFVAGVEAECKLGIAVWPEHYNVGWREFFSIYLLSVHIAADSLIDITSTVGSIGAAVAVGKLMKLNVPKMQKAIGLAAVQVTGMHESFGYDAKPFHVGRAAQNGLMAALLSERNFSASMEGLEGEHGWAKVVSTRENLVLELVSLGEVWEITRNTFKPFPCDRVIHAPIDGLIQVRKQALEKGFDINTITNVTARCHPRVLFLTDTPNPETGLQAKFSIYHAAAVALLYGEAGPVQFSDEVAQNATVKALRPKVHVTSDTAVGSYAAFVTATFENGQTIEVHVSNTIGSYKNPLKTKDLQAKFLEQVGREIGPERATKAFNAYANILDSTDVGKIVKSYQ